MSSVPAPPPLSTPAVPASPSEVRAARAAAHRRPTGLGLAMLALFASLVGAFAVIALAKLDYSYSQAPHRLVKVLIGMTGVGFMLVKPLIGLLVVPIAIPFLEWLPKLPLPGINTTNGLLFGLWLVWAMNRSAAGLPVTRPTALSTAIWLQALVASLGILRAAALPVVPAAAHYDVGFWVLVLWRQIMPMFIYFVVASMIESPRDQRRMAWAVVVALLVESLMTAKLGMSGRGGRAEGSIGQPNELAAYLAMLTPLPLAMIPAVGWIGRFVLAGTLGFALYAQFITLSRGGYIAVSVALLFVAFRTSRMVALLFVLALATSPFWVPDYVVERVQHTTRTNAETDEVELERSSQMRVNTWKAIAGVIQEHPVDGIGTGCLSYILPTLKEGTGSDLAETAHNTYLRVQAELGILGSAALLFLLGSCWRLGERGIRLARDRFERQVSIGFQGALIACILACIFGDRFLSVTVMGGFWVLAAVVEHYGGALRGKAA